MHLIRPRQEIHCLIVHGNSIFFDRLIPDGLLHLVSLVLWRLLDVACSVLAGRNLLFLFDFFRQNSPSIIPEIEGPQHGEYGQEEGNRYRNRNQRLDIATQSIVLEQAFAYSYYAHEQEHGYDSVANCHELDPIPYALE